MTGAKVLTFVIILSPVLANPPTAAAEHGCHFCGYRNVKKVTRLVKTTKEIKIPNYQCSPSESFYPTRHGCTSCKTDCGCKTLHGASPCGSFRETCIKQPTGTLCTRVVPEVRWVTMVMCTRCEHSWPCDEIDTLEPSHPAIAEAQLLPPEPDTRRVVELARPFGRRVSTKSSAPLRQLR